MTKRKTNEEFKREVYDLVGDEYTFLDPYVNNRTKIRVKHNKCGNVYLVQPDSFKRGRRCPTCQRLAQANMRKLSNEQFIKRVYNLVGDEYTVIEPYINSKRPIKIKHNKCGYISRMSPNNFMQGARCKYCAGNVQLTQQQVENRIVEMYGNEYTLLSDYQGMSSDIKLKHNSCNTVFWSNANNFLNKKSNKCPICYPNGKKTPRQFQTDLDNSCGKGRYTIVGDYVNAKSLTKIRCNVCNHTWETKPNWLLTNRSGCPYCNSPKGEVVVNRILKSLSINYETQKTFDDLKDNNLLSYDFFIPGQSILIEYQGKQHYQPVDHFGGKSQFKVQQKHDKMKANYAKANGYNLITIPYTEDTFSKIKKYLLSHGLSK